MVHAVEMCSTPPFSAETSILPSEKSELIVAALLEVDQRYILELARSLDSNARHLAVSFSDCKDVDDEALVDLAKALPKSVEHLSISFDSCPTVGNGILHGLARACPKKMISLRLGFVRCKCLDDAGLQSLARALPQTLSRFELEIRNSTTVSDEGLENIADALPEALQHLKLTMSVCEKICGRGVLRLVKLLPKDLLSIRLDFGLCDIDCRIGDLVSRTNSLREWQTALLAQETALGSPSCASSVAIVAAYLNNPHSLIRQGAVETLGKLEDAAMPHVFDIAELLDDDDCELWPAAAEALVNLGMTAMDDGDDMSAIPSDSTRRSIESENPWRGRSSNSPKKQGMLTRLFSIKPTMTEASCRSPSTPSTASKLSLSSASVARATGTWIAPARGRASTDVSGTGGAIVRTTSDPTFMQRQSTLARARLRSRDLTDKFAKVLSGTKNDQARRAIKKVLRSLGTAVAPHVDALAQHLEDDDDVDVRRAAIEALGHMGAAAKKYTPQLAACLDDDDDEIRRAAAEALANLGSASEQAAVMSDQLAAGREVSRSMVEVLGRMGAAAAPHAALIADCLEHDDWQVRWAAIDALGQLGDASVPHARQLFAKLDDHEMVGEGIDVGQHVRTAAANALMHLPIEVLKALPADELGTMVVRQDFSEELRRKSQQALAAQGAELQVQALKGSLTSKDWKLRASAASALCSIGAANPEVPCLLADMLLDSSMIVRMAAAEGLLKIGLSDDDLPPKKLAFAAFAAHGYEELTSKAAAAFQRLSSSVRATALSELMVHQDKDVKRCAVDALSDCSMSAVPLTAKLLRCLADPDPSVKDTAASSLEKLSDLISPAAPNFTGLICIKRSGLRCICFSQTQCVSLVGGHLFWWSSRADAERNLNLALQGKDPSLQGHVDFIANPCKIICDDTKGPTNFALRPVEGDWKLKSCEGVKQGKDLRLDCMDSDHCAAAWKFMLRMHILLAERFVAPSESETVPLTLDQFIVNC